MTKMTLNYNIKSHNVDGDDDDDDYESVKGKIIT